MNRKLSTPFCIIVLLLIVSAFSFFAWMYVSYYDWTNLTYMPYKSMHKVIGSVQSQAKDIIVNSNVNKNVK